MALRRSWLLRGMSRGYILRRREDLLPEETPLSPAAAWKVVESVLANPKDANDIANLASLGPGATRQLNRLWLQQAIARGAVAVLPSAAEVSRAVPPSDGPESVADQIISAREKKTWVEMELHDMAGDPVPYARYICMLPDGEMREGSLDAKGRVRFDGIPHGNCVFVLPDLDQDAWERTV